MPTDLPPFPKPKPSPPPPKPPPGGHKPRPKSMSRDDDSWVTWTRMCEKLGHPNSIMQIWRKNFPDFPVPHPETKRYEWVKVKAWKDTHPEIGKAVGGTITGKRADLMCEQLEKKNTLLDIQIQEKEGKLVSTDKML